MKVVAGKFGRGPREQGGTGSVVSLECEFLVWSRKIASRGIFFSRAWTGLKELNFSGDNCRLEGDKGPFHRRRACGDSARFLVRKEATHVEERPPEIALQSLL